MINILTKIILKTWLKIFFVTGFGLMLIAVFGDLVNNILRNKYSYSEIFLNLFYESSGMIAKVIPVACIIATLFLFNKLKNHSELTAILASGYPKRKIIQLLLVLGFFAFIIQFFNVAFYAPYLVKTQNQSSDTSALIDNPTPGVNLKALWFKGKDYFGSFLFYDRKNNILASPDIYLFEKSYLQKIISAREASYLKNGSWLLRDVKITQNLSERGKFPEYVTYEQYQVNLNKKVEDFTKYQQGIYSLGIRSLYKFISELRKTGLNVAEYLVFFYDKLAVSFSCILFTLFPLSALNQVSKRSSSPGRSILFALVFSVVFWVAASGLQSFALSNTIPPVIASFALHVGVAIYLLKTYFSLEKLR